MFRSRRALIPTPRHLDAVTSRAIAAYLGLALGDAMGSTVEFMTPREIQARFGRHRKMVGGGWLQLKPGQITDDTGMALALGAAILEQCGRVEAHAVATAFDGWMRSKPVDIGHTVRRGLLRFRTTGEPLLANPTEDAGNGACMRTLPVAIVTAHRPLQEMVDGVLTQAHVTHNNPLSDAGTLCLCEMVRLALHGGQLGTLVLGPMRRLVEFSPLFAFRGRKRPMENPSGYIVETLRAVFEALVATDNYEDCVVEVINRGGDADTTGAIAGMAAGALYGLDALPTPWLATLDPAIRVACVEQAMALSAIYAQETATR